MGHHEQLAGARVGQLVAGEGAVGGVGVGLADVGGGGDLGEEEGGEEPTISTPEGWIRKEEKRVLAEVQWKTLTSTCCGGGRPEGG